MRLRTVTYSLRRGLHECTVSRYNHAGIARSRSTAKGDVPWVDFMGLASQRCCACLADDRGHAGARRAYAGCATVVQGSGDPGFYQGPIFATITKNVWYDFVYHVKWSSGSDGYFQAWLNGVQKLNYAGPTIYSGAGCYLKLADYHSPIGQTVSIIHDRIISAATQAGLGSISGGGGGGDTTAPSVPTGLAGSAVSSAQINLTWNPSTDSV